MTPVFMPAEARDAQSFFEIASAQPYAAQWSAQAFEAEIKNNFAKVFKLEAGGKAAAFICFRAAYETGE
ncbi:MAG: hypothetical protein LBR90_02650, partial [Elusimicrobiota bacterium]|nr:hypothetical protein [Elusimicrobiota bacterium]